MDFRAPPVKLIADFLLYLFQDRKLQPSTIDGYRSSLADHPENSPINVSKEVNLTCLLDRPKGLRTIPSWNLSLVLHQLTKAPFEPIKRGLFEAFDIQDHLPLGPGSGKCMSEIHAWQNKNIRHQSDWSKVSLYPSAGQGGSRQCGPSGYTSPGPNSG